MFPVKIYNSTIFQSRGLTLLNSSSSFNYKTLLNCLIITDWVALACPSSVELQTSDFIFFDGSNRRKKFMSKSQLLSGDF